MATAAKPQSAGSAHEAELHRLGFAFKRTIAAIRTLKGRQTSIGGGELSRAQFELLGELLDHGDLSAGELATAAQVSPATVSGMLDHLVACGHVERSRSERDRRIVVCRLTDRGRTDLEAKRADWRDRWHAAFADVPVRDLTVASAVLERIADIFDDVLNADRPA